MDGSLQSGSNDAPARGATSSEPAAGKRQASQRAGRRSRLSFIALVCANAALLTVIGWVVLSGIDFEHWLLNTALILAASGACVGSAPYRFTAHMEFICVFVAWILFLLFWIFFAGASLIAMLSASGEHQRLIWGTWEALAVLWILSLVCSVLALWAMRERRVA
ncbi:MAG: hypothetical protein EA376_04115 [Phycisphaeraceae bacterium]|nr:MAG: hypothetical protein EA376_04115 [Phycisphaeraceae bacterium]